MTDATDRELVREFARCQSETAFAEIVRRHLNLVYSVALRYTGPTADAQDIAQAVFIILARKAGRLSDRTVLTGWLYETTRFTAAHWQRTAARRHIREQEAYMQSREPEAAAVWQQLAPHLEAAMSQLAERDRTLLALRFYENKTAPETAALLGIRPDTAQKRVSRALEKLRKFFTKRGVALSAAAIAGAVSVNSVQAAPVGLAKTISVVAIAKGAAASASILTLVKGALKLMAWTKMKTAAVVGAGVLLVGGPTIAVMEINANHSAALKILNEVEAKYAALDFMSYSGEGRFETHSHTNQTTFSVRLGRPGSFRMEDKIQVESWNRGMENEGSWRWTDGDYSLMYSTVSYLKPNTLYKIRRSPAMQQASYSSLQLDSVINSCLPTYFFFNSDLKNPFRILASTNSNIKVSLHGEQQIGKTRCQKLVIHIPGHDMRLTLWIGKQDRLIYQSEQYEEKGETTPQKNYPAVQIETYHDISTNVQFSKEDFIPENIPTGLTVSDKFP